MDKDSKGHGVVDLLIYFRHQILFFCSLSLTEVIGKYRDKIAKLELDVKEIEWTEQEEKEMRATENQINKANNLLENPGDQHKRDWFQTHKQRMQEQGRWRYYQWKPVCLLLTCFI